MGQANTRQPTRFLVIEDNWDHADTLKEWLEIQFRGAAVRVMATEKEFQEGIDAIVQDPPDVIILDLMVKYTTVDDTVPLPTEVTAEGMFTAGAHCYDQLARHNLDDRVILYSLIGEDGLRKEQLEYLLKVHVQKRPDKDNLMRAILARLNVR